MNGNNEAMLVIYPDQVPKTNGCMRIGQTADLIPESCRGSILRDQSFLFILMFAYTVMYFEALNLII